MVCYLKENHSGFLEERRLKDLVEKNSVMGFPIEIVDFVISMTKNELVTNLGPIVQPSTKSLMDAMAAGGDISMFGQFVKDFARCTSC